ncbi:hypothetical protein OS189_07010 [Sulfitobacter sp. F26169L]|nr:hypothetical protein [Sulfitobacter sp. F26169L]
MVAFADQSVLAIPALVDNATRMNAVVPAAVVTVSPVVPDRGPDL